MPLVEGVGVVDSTTNDVLICVSKGPVSHSTIYASLKKASESRTAWDNALCVSAPIHVVAITSSGHDDYDWETYVFPVLEKCSNVIKAVCGSDKVTTSKIERNYAAVYLGLMRVVVLGIEGVSTANAVNHRVINLIPWGNKTGLNPPLLSCPLLPDPDGKFIQSRRMEDSVKMLAQLRSDFSMEDALEQPTLESFAVEEESRDLEKLLGNAFLPPPAYEMSEEEDDEDSEVENDEEDDTTAFPMSETTTQRDHDELYDDDDEEDEAGDYSSDEEKQDIIDGQPIGNYSTIRKIPEPTRKRRTLSAGARDRVRQKEEEQEARRRAGEGKLAEDGPRRKKTTSSVDTVRVPSESEAALAAAGDMEIGRDLAWSLTDEPDMVLPPPLMSPPSSSLSLTSLTDDDENAKPPPSPPPSALLQSPDAIEAITVGAAAMEARRTARSVSFVPPPEESPPMSSDEESIPGDVPQTPTIPPYGTPPFVSSDEEQEVDEEEDRDYSGPRLPLPLPQQDTSSDDDEEVGYSGRQMTLPVPQQTSSDEEEDEESPSGRAISPPGLPPVLSSDEEDDEIPPPGFPPIVNSDEEEEAIPPPGSPPLDEEDEGPSSPPGSPLMYDEEDVGEELDAHLRRLSIHTPNVPPSPFSELDEKDATDDDFVPPPTESPPDMEHDEMMIEQSSMVTEESVSQLPSPPPVSAVRSASKSSLFQPDLLTEEADANEGPLIIIPPPEASPPDSENEDEEETSPPDEPPPFGEEAERRLPPPPIESEDEEEEGAPPPDSPPPPDEHERTMFSPDSDDYTYDIHSEGHDGEDLFISSLQQRDLEDTLPDPLPYEQGWKTTKDASFEGNEEETVMPPAESPLSSEDEEAPPPSHSPNDEDDVDEEHSMPPPESPPPPHNVDDAQSEEELDHEGPPDGEKSDGADDHSPPPPESPRGSLSSGQQGTDDDEIHDDGHPPPPGSPRGSPVPSGRDETDEETDRYAAVVSPLGSPTSSGSEDDDGPDDDHPPLPPDSPVDSPASSAVEEEHLENPALDDRSVNHSSEDESSAYPSATSRQDHFDLQESQQPPLEHDDRSSSNLKAPPSIRETQEDKAEVFTNQSLGDEQNSNRAGVEPSGVQRHTDDDSPIKTIRISLHRGPDDDNDDAKSSGDEVEEQSASMMTVPAVIAANTSKPVPRIELHLHEDCVLKLSRGAFSAAPKFRGKIYVGSPDTADKDVFLSGITMRAPSSATVERFDDCTDLVVGNGSFGVEVKLPKGTRTNPPHQVATFFNENESCPQPVKVGCGVEIIQTAQGVFAGHLIARLAGNPKLGVTEFTNLGLEINLAMLKGCTIDRIKFVPQTGRFDSSSHRIIFPNNGGTFELGITHTFEAKFTFTVDDEDGDVAGLLGKHALPCVLRFESKGATFCGVDLTVDEHSGRLRGIARRSTFKVECGI